MRLKILLFGTLLAALPGCKFLVSQTIAAFTEVIRWSNGLTKGTGQVTADGKLQTGPWKFFYRDGRVRSEGAYADDVQVGPWKYYYENGNVEWEGSYDAKGLRTGLWHFFHDNGRERAEGEYVDDREHGLWCFFDREGKPTQEGDFERGRLAGFWIHCYPDGKPKARGLHFEGVRVGPWRYWTEDGKETAEDLPLPEGVQVVREVWPNGSLRRLGLKRGEQPVGGWATFHDNGNLRARGWPGEGADQPWSIADADGRLLACGRIVNKEFVGIRLRTDGVMRSEGSEPIPRLPPDSAKEWSPATIADGKPIAEVASVWLAEMAAPVDLMRAAPAVLTAVAPPPALVEATDQNPRIPAKGQPSFTFRELEELPKIIEEYTKTMFNKAGAGGRYPATRPKRESGERKDLLKKPLPAITLSVVDGDSWRPLALAGKKNCVLAVMRGLSGYVCIYCVAQTLALSDSKAKFDALGVDLIVVYPGQQGDERAFMQAYAEESQELERMSTTIPYQVACDPELELVKALGIESNLADPTMIYVDGTGLIRYAYTGQNRADRPPVQQILEAIEKSRP